MTITKIWVEKKKKPVHYEGRKSISIMKGYE